MRSMRHLRLHIRTGDERLDFRTSRQDDGGSQRQKEQAVARA